MVLPLFPAWMMPDLTASSGLRIGFLALCALFILLSALDGRREGLGRKSFGVIALIGGVLAGYFGADFWGALAGKFLPYPPPALKVVGGFGGFLIFSLGFSLIGMLVFRPTRKVKDPELKRMVGIGGAIAGLVLGALSVLLLLIMVRIAGHFGESFIRGYGPALEQNSQSEEAVDIPPQTELALDSLAWIVRLNRSLEGLPGEGAIAAIDPVPDKTYRVMDKTVRVLSDPVALERMANQPQTRQLLDEPVVQQMLQDEEIAALAREQDIHGLMSHPRVMALAQDPELAALLETYQLEAALDAALDGPPSPPVPASGASPSGTPSTAPGDQSARPQPPLIIIEPVEGS
ncbi:MAG: CvpA family protein [Verrucomicrobiota bacterium JB024]|nr:CvpA family protein [Verrucomicrobiota bacterium JB024]